MHAHTSGISRCCRADAETIVKIAKENKIDGLVLTNHYDRSYIENGDGLSFAEKYVDEYVLTEKVGRKYGVKVFFGIEVSAERLNNAHLLVYGVDFDFVYRYHDMFCYPQEKLYQLVKDSGGILVWAHPFRGGYNDGVSLKHLDGLEINCHPLYGKTFFDEVKRLAKDNGLILTCGADYHHDVPYRPYCGTIFDNEVNDIFEIVKCLRTSEEIRLMVQEVNASYSFEYLFKKTGQP